MYGYCKKKFEGEKKGDTEIIEKKEDNSEEEDNFTIKLDNFDSKLVPTDTTIIVSDLLDSSLLKLQKDNVDQFLNLNSSVQILFNVSKAIQFL